MPHHFYSGDATVFCAQNIYRSKLTDICFKTAWSTNREPYSINLPMFSEKCVIVWYDRNLADVSSWSNCTFTKRCHLLLEFLFSVKIKIQAHINKKKINQHKCVEKFLEINFFFQLPVAFSPSYCSEFEILPRTTLPVVYSESIKKVIVEIDLPSPLILPHLVTKSETNILVSRNSKYFRTISEPYVEIPIQIRCTVF